MRDNSPLRFGSHLGKAKLIYMYGYFLFLAQATTIFMAQSPWKYSILHLYENCISTTIPSYLEQFQKKFIH